MNNEHVRLGFDFYGKGNAGDDLMLGGFLHAWPRRTVFVCKVRSEQLNVLRMRFPQVRWVTSNEEIPPYTVWLGVGDTPIQVLSGTFFIEYLESEFGENKHCKTLFGLVGVGAEEEALRLKERFKAILERCAYIGTRDQQTTDVICRGFGVNKPRIFTGADLAHIALSRMPEPQPAARPISVGLNYYAEERSWWYTIRLMLMLRRFSKAQRVVFLANEEREFRGSEVNLYKVARILRQSKDVPLLKPNYSKGDLFGLVSHFDQIETVLSSRYHVIVAAAWRGCRVCGIARSSKVKDLCHQLNLPMRTPKDILHNLDGAVSCARWVPREGLQSLACMAESGVQEMAALSK